jgi:RES domain-containing protein
MRYFRLIEDLPGRDPLGYGLAPGRWNHPGTPMIYACSASSLNFLEMLSIKGSIVTKSAWKLVVFELSAPAPELDLLYLPENWKNRPYPSTTQEFGTAWAKSKLSATLKIPSCRIPLGNYATEHNLLLNPLHADFSTSIRSLESWKVSFEVNQ